MGIGIFLKGLNYLPPYLLAMTFAFCYTPIVQAQTKLLHDTAYYDLGRTLLRKDFTLSMQVLGKDLTRIAYGSTAEAIQTYFGFENLVYVIDGQVASDINDYSIYDIKQVNILDHAAGTLHGSFRNSKLALVETYSAADLPQNRFQLAARSGLGHPRSSRGPKPKASLYQQYYLSAHGQTAKLNGGISMDYMATNRQIPRFTNTGDMRVNSTDNQVRIRGYGNYDISNSHGLSVEAISSPIRANNDLLADTYTTTEKRRLHSMLGRIRLDSRLTERLANTLSMSYVWSESGKSQSAENSESMSWRSSRYDLDYYGRHSLLHNRTTYHFSIGALGVTPQLSASWRILSGSKKYHSEVFNQQGNPSSVTRGMFGLGAQHRILLAPSLHLHYKDIAYLQSGLHVDFSKSDILLSDDSEKYFPFLSGGWDLGKMLLPELQWSVLLTGSYAKTGNFSDETTDRLFSRFPPDGGGAILRPPFNTDRTIGNYWQAGSKISYGQDKFFAQYWYSKADYPANLELPFMTAENIREHVRSHYIGGGTQLHQNGWQWRSNLLIRWQFVSLQNQAAQGEANFQRPATTPRNLLDERWGNPRDGEDRVVVEFPSGVSKVKPNLYTEWNHRLHYNQLFVGLDLFHASQQVFSDVITTPNQSSIRSIDQKTSMGLRTLHLGYQFSAFGASQLEAYGFMRNFSENEMGLSSENAFRTYGAGLMFSL